jgi:FkbM family methyltransferase
MLQRNIITSKGKPYVIESDDEVIIEWFSNPVVNHTEIIIDQLNQGLYNEFFQGKKDLTIIDAGANIGLFSIYAQDSCKKIVAIEPAPHNVYVLERLLSNFDNVELEMSALHGEDTQVPFYIHSSPTCNSTVNNSTGLKIDVEAKTIETIMREHNLDSVDFIKCDIEGSEVLALTEQTIQPVADKVKFWWVEIHQTNINEQVWPGNLEQNRQSLSRIFNNNGYQTRSIIHDQLIAWK